MCTKDVRCKADEMSESRWNVCVHTTGALAASGHKTRGPRWRHGGDAIERGKRLGRERAGSHGVLTIQP